jgi:exopolysaccharide production protein ExoQ
MLLAAKPIDVATPLRSRYLDSGILFSALLATAVLSVLAKYQADQDAPVSSPIAQVVWSLFYITAVVRLIAMRSKALPLLARSRVLWAYVILMFASFVWSVSPTTSLVDSIELVGTTFIGYYVVARFTVVEFLEILAAVFATIAILSFALIFGAPGHGRMDWGSGAWSGVYAEKNNLGAAMSLAVLSLLTLLLVVKGRTRILVVGVLTLCLTLLAGSNSATAFADLLVAAVVGFAALCWRSPRIGMIAGVISIVGLVMAGAAVYIFGITPDSVPALFGRSATLTGRTDFWPYLLQAIADRPVLGFGYNAFFSSSVGANYLSDYVLLQAGGWSPYHAHNSFFQACLDGGYVGATLLVILIVSSFLKSVGYLVKNASRAAVWPLVMIVYMLFGSFTETYLGRYNTFEWIFFVAACLYPLKTA